MKLCQCTHEPLVVRIVFDNGNNQTEVFELCRLCQELEVFMDFIISKEAILENNDAEVKFRHQTSAIKSSELEMIT